MMLSQKDIEIIRALQEGLPLVSRPFQVLAQKVGLSEEELLNKVREFVKQGIIRRFGAAVRHQDLGYISNAMVVWEVPEEKIEEIGRLMASFDEISHCYQRPSRPPEWPYNLFTVIHGQTRDECEKIAARLSRASGITSYRLLFSLAEFKKSSMKYFMEK
ncbi:transcriptional regulator, AsnC family [Desulfofundulus australicus DSM 11792]|uniref:siroheme decarboxylase n=2 Tax=Desulfofundulus australicus TaxID=1566 RepID=A0A1M5DEF5_9FIRM|nr:transcriptional regulator, AsnC family [Desulfofundulus australicus DSM 11792]